MVRPIVLFFGAREKRCERVARAQRLSALTVHDSQDSAYFTMASAALAARTQLVASPMTYSC